MIEEEKEIILNDEVLPIPVAPSVGYEPTPIPENKAVINIFDWFLEDSHKHKWQITSFLDGTTNPTVHTSFLGGRPYYESPSAGYRYVTISIVATSQWAVGHLNNAISNGETLYANYKNERRGGKIIGELDWESVVNDGEYYTASDIQLILL